MQYSATTEMSQLEAFANSLGQLMLVWQKVYREILVEENLSPVDKRILYGLLRKPGITKKELAQAIVLEDSSITRSMQRLEKQGLLTRQVGCEDRRAIVLSLTDLGVERTRRVKAKFLHKIKPCLPGIGEQELKGMVAFIHRMTENIKADINKES